MEDSHIIVGYLSVISCFSFSLIFQLHFGCYISEIAYDLVKPHFSKPRFRTKKAVLDLELRKEQTSLMLLSCQRKMWYA